MHTTSLNKQQQMTTTDNNNNNNKLVVVMFEDRHGKFYLDYTGGWSSRRIDAIPVDPAQVPHIIKEHYDWDRLVKLQTEPLWSQETSNNKTTKTTHRLRRLSVALVHLLSLE